jgi:hypothetical protein
MTEFAEKDCGIQNNPMFVGLESLKPTSIVQDVAVLRLAARQFLECLSTSRSYDIAR